MWLQDIRTCITLGRGLTEWLFRPSTPSNKKKSPSKKFHLLNTRPTVREPSVRSRSVSRHAGVLNNLLNQLVKYYQYPSAPLPDIDEIWTWEHHRHTGHHPRQYNGWNEGDGFFNGSNLFYMNRMFFLGAYQNCFHNFPITSALVLLNFIRTFTSFKV